MAALSHFAAESVRDFFRRRIPVRNESDGQQNDTIHIEAAVTFLTRSIDNGEGHASSKAYRIGKGWLPPYRETTGYIIPTLIEAGLYLNREDLVETAERMGEWLAEIQEPSGGFIEHDLRQDTKPIVFNTGQILHGFNSLILRRGRDDLIPSARRAAEFLISCADETGSFVRNEHYNMPHAYNVRSAWALLTLGELVESKTYTDAALANADWTIGQQTEAGFFRNNIFQTGWNANTHGIAYVLQGLLEIHCICGRPDYLEAVRRTADCLVSLYSTRGYLASEIGENWEFLSKHVCLTGYAQLALVFFNLYSLEGDAKYLNAAYKLLDDVAATQDVRRRDKPHFGGIKGSLPIYGRYAPLQYPNWATKFFLDALLAKQAISPQQKDGTRIRLSAG